MTGDKRNIIQVGMKRLTVGECDGMGVRDIPVRI